VETAFVPAIERWQHLILVIAQRTLTLPVCHWLRAKWKRIDYPTPAGWVRLGSLRRVTPLSRDFGYDRGRPIDRYYIEKFLSDQRLHIVGHVLEVANDNYTREFGRDRVVKSDVLHVSFGDPRTTIIGDLTAADHIPSDTFDCVIITQTLQLIYDVRAALQTIRRILTPGGVVIATFPGISPISRYDADRWGYYWSFTSQSAQRLFGEVFPPDQIHVNAYGNVLSATAFLYGMATDELRQKELDYSDPDYEVIIAVRGTKPERIDRDPN
jgi:SAM-dependent methyltransferase